MKKKEEQQTQQEQVDNADNKKKNDMNLDLDYWKKRFLYPFALDKINTAPLKLIDG